MSIKTFNRNINGCGCGGDCVQNGIIEDVTGAFNSNFFNEVFPKDSKTGNRALVTRVEIDTPSLLKFGAIILGAIVVFKKLK